MTLLADINHSGTQEDMVSNWESAHSLVEDGFSGAKIATAPCFLGLVVTRLPFCLWERRPYTAASLPSFGIRSILCSVSAPGVTMLP